MKTILTALLGGLLCSAHSAMIETELRIWDSTKAFNGYTLFGAKGKSYLIDMSGKVAHLWTTSGTNPKLLPYNGNLLDVTNSGKTIQEVDWDGNKVWEYTESRSNYAPHHDFIRIFNKKLGEYTTLYIANKSIPADTVLAAGADPATGPYDGAQIDVITEVDMRGKIIWEWGFLNHLVQDIDPTKANYVGAGKTIADYPNRLDANLPGRPIRRDWLHCNSLDYNPTSGQIVINSVQGEFYVIDHDNTFVKGDSAASIALAASSAGDFLYRFGDPARYEQGLPPSISTDWTKSSTGHKQIGGAHDIHWIEEGLPGAGNFLIFNNGEYLFENTPQSYIFEINPMRTANGSIATSYVNPPDAGYWIWEGADPDQMKSKKNMSNQIVWKYSSLNPGNFYSTIGSSAGRLPNGNTLITAMTTGDLFEVTDSGQVVWEYIVPLTEDGIKTSFDDQFPNYNAVFRSYRYGADHIAFKNRTLNATQTITQSAGNTALIRNFHSDLITVVGTELSLLSTSTQELGSLQIVNIYGQVLHNQKLNPGSSKISLSHLPPGKYTAVLHQNQQFHSKSFHIQ